ncbi:MULTISPECIES: SMR family transporter [Pandoraea]|uniref:DMT family transporter n=1 Tax=Pandoraea TaxID=93217 RepID=UPI001F5D2A79|nr:MULTISPECIES: SMR family transporter [Pandoraea]MCI3206040.1 QacE family quaternary ammonium compound efflux SMR transporter [Pandoraea sp. LA3]MDN4584068.1 QacE family quaternary ammonium compound efflux SMR transporter [Pandoraea capi]
MAWIYLLLAAALEIGMGLALKLNQGWTRVVPSGLAVAAALASIYLLALALRALPVGMAYAIWTGIGSVGLVVVGVLWFGESLPWTRVGFLALTIVGIAGLRFSEGGAA